MILKDCRKHECNILFWQGFSIQERLTHLLWSTLSSNVSELYTFRYLWCQGNSLCQQWHQDCGWVFGMGCKGMAAVLNSVLRESYWNSSICSGQDRSAVHSLCSAVFHFEVRYWNVKKSAQAFALAQWSHVPVCYLDHLQTSVYVAAVFFSTRESTV